MTETPHQNLPRWAVFADEILTAAEVRRRAAIAAVRRFVDEIHPVVSDRSRCKTVIDSRLDLAEDLTAARILFRRSVVHSVGQLVTKD
jgi:hypothetical protein